jgi:NADH-quinone oxidoreductase subunit C
MHRMASTIDHPTLRRVRDSFPDSKFQATEFRGQTTLIVEPGDAHTVLRFLREHPECDYALLSDVTAVDYLDYPAPMPGRFAVVWVLRSFTSNDLLVVKTFLDPEGDTTGNDPDPGLRIPSVCDLWPGAEWREREAYDMFGIEFTGHPDLRRILTWGDFPAFPLRKDYPLRGRGERENHEVVDRDST